MGLISKLKSLTLFLELIDKLTIKLTLVIWSINWSVFPPTSLSYPIVLVVIASCQEVLSLEPGLLQVESLLWDSRLQVVLHEIFRQVLLLVILSVLGDLRQIVEL